jgi:hypothetical protein
MVRLASHLCSVFHPIEKPLEGFSSVLNQGSVILLICYGVDAAGEEIRGVVEVTGESSRVCSFSSEKIEACKQRFVARVVIRF